LCRQIILVTLSTNRTFLIDLRKSAQVSRLELFDVFQPAAEEGSDVDMEDQEDVKGKGREKAVVEDVRKKPTFVRGLFSPDGRRIYLGTKGGELLVLDGKTKDVSLLSSRRGIPSTQNLTLDRLTS
jgi:hypothetical protein